MAAKKAKSKKNAQQKKTSLQDEQGGSAIQSNNAASAKGEDLMYVSPSRVRSANNYCVTICLIKSHVVIFSLKLIMYLNIYLATGPVSTLQNTSTFLRMWA